MTSDQIAKVIDNADAAWHGTSNEPLMNPNEPTDVAHYRATLEVAFQLAFLNEQIGEVLNSRIPQIRVMVENGDWPLSVKQV